MAKRKLGAIPYLYPVPIVLVGAVVDGRPNFAEIGDCAIMGIRPPLVAVSLSAEHHTTRGILAHRTFSVNVPNTDLLGKTDRCGIVSGKDVDKSVLFEVEYGETTTAPLIVACPVVLECRVVEEVEIEHRRIFIGGVLQCHVDETYVVEKDGRRSVAALTELDPILYALDNAYYSVGRCIGIGTREGLGAT